MSERGRSAVGLAAAASCVPPVPAPAPAAAASACPALKSAFSLFGGVACPFASISGVTAAAGAR